MTRTAHRILVLLLAVAVPLLAPASAEAATKRPVVSSVAPATGFTTGGTAVTVKGKNFTRKSTVSFGGVRATKVRFVSSKKLVATAPASNNPRRVNVTVKTSRSTSTTSTKTRFTYTLRTNLGTDTLARGRTLQRTQYLTSAKGAHRLVMQGDGNLVLYQVKPWKALWSSRTSTGSTATLQDDGNLVVRDAAGKPVWNAGTSGFTEASLKVQDDGNLVLTNRGVVAWSRSTGYVGDRLRSGTTLASGAYLRSKDKKTRLVMQGDGNLVLYTGSKARWASHTRGTNTATMQADGNLVVYRKGGGALFSTRTTGFRGAELTVQDDGNAVVYQRGLPVWVNGSYRGAELASGRTMNAGAVRMSPDRRHRLVMQGDGNLVLYTGATALWASHTSGDNRAVMQGDGNLVVYRNGGGALWSTGTGDRAGARLLVQDDANLVIYQGSTAVWSRHGTNADLESKVDAFVRATKGRTVGDGECVALIKSFLQEVWGIHAGAWGNAVDYRAGSSGGQQLAARGFTWSTAQDFRDGDILVWGPDASAGQGQFGHIGVWHAGRVYDQNDVRGRANPRTADHADFWSGGYLGRWRK